MKRKKRGKKKRGYSRGKAQMRGKLGIILLRKQERT